MDNKEILKILSSAGDNPLKKIKSQLQAAFVVLFMTMVLCGMVKQALPVVLVLATTAATIWLIRVVVRRHFRL